MVQVNYSFQADQLHVRIYEEKSEMGLAAANFVATHIQDAIEQKGTANLILATGASQFSLIEALNKKEIEWKKVTVVHLDEYKGISDQHPASFRKYLKERILNSVKPGKVYLINGDAANLEEEIAEYEKHLKAHPIDIACIGIGENGHIAFNDPPVADFDDPKWVKVVELDHACRMQQLGEGWFPSFDDVPKEAVTLTISAIMSCKTICCVVPDERKSVAVHNTIYNEISTECPATILRKHPDTVLFLDMPASCKIEKK
jgi:glucosamine-6-phosphate deaminase